MLRIDVDTRGSAAPTLEKDISSDAVATMSDYYGGVRERITTVLGIPQASNRSDTFTSNAIEYSVLSELRPPIVQKWVHITDEELAEVSKFIKRTQEVTAPIGSDALRAKLNADDRFFQHLNVMLAYIDVLCESEQFQEFLKAANIHPNFLRALVLLHDYGRCVFNGPLPLKFVDNVSGALLYKVLPSFPQEYLHTIKWITEEEPFPDMKDGKELEVDSISLEYLIGFILKAVDTLGKIDPQGNLIDINTFFDDNGLYDSWLQKQKANSRLPFNVTASVNVTPDQYAANDRRLTEKGAQVIESKTGLPFAEIRNLVAERLTKQLPV